jgi:hypothetical protein
VADPFCVLRPLGEIRELVRVVLQIEELERMTRQRPARGVTVRPLALASHKNKLPAAIPDHDLIGPSIRDEHVLAVRRRRPFQHPDEAAALDSVGDSQAAVLQHF